MSSLLRSIYAGGAVLGLTGMVIPAVSLLSYPNEELPDPFVRAWARGILRSSDVRVTVQGLENIPATGNFVLVCNHQSHFDSLVIFSHIKRHMRFVAKAELFKIPLFGFALKAAGNIRVLRDGSEKDRQAITHAIEAVRERTCIIFFPEGTRSEDGILRSFKKGASILAIQAQVPLIPIAVAGTVNILPKGSLRIQGGKHVALCIGTPIPTKDLIIEDRDALTQQSHQAVAALLATGEAIIKNT
jgi:1-acyl-sn-glycerol-3-phosphate acyltransferase